MKDENQQRFEFAEDFVLRYFMGMSSSISEENLEIFRQTYYANVDAIQTEFRTPIIESEEVK